MTAKVGAVDRRHYRIGSVRKVGEVGASARLLDSDGAVLTHIVQERAHLPDGDICREIQVSHVEVPYPLLPTAPSATVNLHA